MAIKKMTQFPDKKYNVIVCDPPWSYKNKKTGGSMVSGAEAKYHSLTLDEIISLPVKDIADKDCVLFLWVTTPLKYEIAQAGIVERWGFHYKTAIYWRKIMSLGMGFWYRGQVEECWLCTKGKIKAFRCQKPNIIQSKVRSHSQKPEEFFEIIEPSLDKFELNRRIELFARTRRNKWESWGSELREEQ